MSDKLSRDEIRAMEAGEALNVLVAERVMGWHWDMAWDCYIPPEQMAKPGEMWSDWKKEIDPDRWKTARMYCEPIKEHHINGIVYNANSTRIFMPDWSTDIAAAWQVVEKLHNGGWWVRIKSAMNDELEQLGWAVHIGRWWNRESLGEWALTTPLAICRAALLAAMEEG